MKKILLIIIIFLFSFSVNAKEIIMSCTNTETLKETAYKWKKPLIGKTAIFMRYKGDWVKWCKKNEKKGHMHLKSILILLDKGARCETSFEYDMDSIDNYDTSGTTDSYLDFEIMERERNIEYTHYVKGKKKYVSKKVTYVCVELKKDSDE